MLVPGNNYLKWERNKRTLLVNITGRERKQNLAEIWAYPPILFIVCGYDGEPYILYYPEPTQGERQKGNMISQGSTLNVSTQEEGSHDVLNHLANNTPRGRATNEWWLSIQLMGESWWPKSPPFHPSTHRKHTL